MEDVPEAKSCSAGLECRDGEETRSSWGAGNVSHEHQGVKGVAPGAVGSHCKVLNRIMAWGYDLFINLYFTFISILEFIHI